MPRTLAAIASLGLLTLAAVVAVGVFQSGCGKKSENTAKTSGKNRTAKHEPPVKNWPKPAFALVISGEQKGYLEPCGCTAENQMGGLAHRADLMRQLREDRKWDVAGLDLGDLILRTREQDKLKLQQILKGLQQLEYFAVGLGTHEMLLARNEPTWMLSLSGFSAETKGVKLPFVAANASVLELGPRRWHIHSVAGKKIAVTSVFGKKYRRKILPEGANAELKISDPEKSLPPVLSEMKAAKPDFMVLLAFTDLKDETEKLAKLFPDFDLIVSAGGPEDGKSEPQTVGKTMIVNVGQKGKHVGIVGFYPDSKQNRLRYELVELDAHRFKEDSRMHDLMLEYQQMLKDNLDDVFRDVGGQSHPSGATFLGAKSCKDCHKSAYAVWIKSKHAQAYDSLSKGRPGVKKWISRTHDPECLACHVTGWKPQEVTRYKSGFQIMELAEAKGKPALFQKLKGQQCENCHGPGSTHVDLESKWLKDPDSVKDDILRKSRRDMQVTIEASQKRGGCYSCHDLDNSPKFNFKEYWEKIKHTKD